MVKMPIYATVPRSWEGETAVLLGCGPSLTAEDVASCQGQARVIAIKDAHLLAPWADVLYSGDERWWEKHGRDLTFAGDRYALVEPRPNYVSLIAQAQASLLRIAGIEGLESSPDGLRTGQHSGYQAINLAVHFGVRRIVLLGYDMQASGGRDHFRSSHAYQRKPTPYGFRRHYESLVAPLRALGVEVVNATRSTALTVFPRVSLHDALSAVPHAA